MRKSLFGSVVLTIILLSITSGLSSAQSANPNFRPPLPTPTPFRPTPTPTPPPGPTPTPTPTPAPTPSNILANAINQRGLGSRTSPAIRAAGAANLVGSRSYTYSLPLFSLPGRHALNVNLALYYNSLLWDSAYNVATGTTAVSFNSQFSPPSPGFQLDYGYISWAFAEFSVPNGVFVDATGAKHPLVGDASGTQFHTVDSSYISVLHHFGTSTTDLDSDLVTYKNGMQVQYAEAAGSLFTCCPGAIGNSGSRFITRPIKIEDTSGNSITINYVDNASVTLGSLVDTVGRTITFVYNQNLLTCVTDGASCNAAGSRTYSFSWNTNYILSFQFTNVTGGVGFPVEFPLLQGSQFPYTVLAGVTRPDGTRVSFNYGDWFIVNDIQELSNNGTLRYESSYNFPPANAGALSDVPTYTQQTVTTFDKDGNPQLAKWLYQSALTNTGATRLVSCSAITDPVGTIHITTCRQREIFLTDFRP